jgi:hypothetical protein
LRALNFLCEPSRPAEDAELFANVYDHPHEVGMSDRDPGSSCEGAWKGLS